MAAYHGRGGAILAPTGLGEVTAWTYNEAAEETEAPAMGLTAKRYLAGLVEAGGQFTVNYDNADAVAEALDVGDSVVLELHPRGTGTTLPKFESTGNSAGGTVVITGVEVSGDVSGVIQRTYTFRNDLVRGTQA